MIEQILEVCGVILCVTLTGATVAGVLFAAWDIWKTR